MKNTNVNTDTCDIKGKCRYSYNIVPGKTNAVPGSYHFLYGGKRYKMSPRFPMIATDNCGTVINIKNPEFHITNINF